LATLFCSKTYRRAWDPEIVMGRNKAWLVIMAILVGIGIMLYLYRSSTTRLDVEPHARQEIEKAKRR
jgi:hypothetical protein